MPNWTGTWAGGRTYQTKDGQKVWVIRKMVNGHRHQIALDSETERQALAQLALFEQDPASYKTPSQQRAEARLQAQEADEKARLEAEARRRQDEHEATYLDAASVARFLEHIKDRTPKYKKDTRYYLSAWADALRGSDLRKVEPREVLRLLAQWNTAEQKRIAALKAFCSFLFKKGLLDPAQDPSRTLTVPASRPEKAIREKGYPMATIEVLYRALNDQGARDVLLLHAKLGLHESEVQRIAAGEGKITLVPGHPVISGTVKFVHKSGRVHTLSLDAQALAAAQRLQAHGAPTPDQVRHRLRLACEAHELPRVKVGELRHSFVAWSLEAGEAVTLSGNGVPLALVASVLEHTSTVTTKKFYDVSKVPSMIKLPLKLEHAEDPQGVKAAA
ncbi:site-specific integrase [Corallococcus sp. CA047B]|uniref:site-specific integrase n=1 Tax=Corallococcus sp. CA047B TaxID=2316729 RepID=UPI000EA2118C|nr:site-specific integrase [Corallococcus sp. CA047B]RKH08466.1 site-specific integrase [Corallococcus sp. CA047B]